MTDCSILAWHPLLRPPLPNEEPPAIPDGPLKALTCRNAVTSLSALVISNAAVDGARLVFTDLVSDNAAIPSTAIRVRLVSSVPTPEAGEVSDPLYDVDEFAIKRSASLYITVSVPKGIPAGIYSGRTSLVINGKETAFNNVEIEVADVDLPSVHDYTFFMNVWMNPACIARWHNVEMWSDEHFALLKPYVEDLASHGQKTVLVPICYQPWGTQTRNPYPNAVIWKKCGEDYEFDFSIFDRYVELHEACGIDRAIHCYSVIQTVGESGQSVIEYIDAESGETKRITAELGDAEYARAWKAFFGAFREHLITKGWLQKVYIAFDERPAEVMEKVLSFLNEYAHDFRIALAANTRSEVFTTLDDLCLATPFDENGITEPAPPERRAMGMAELMDPDNVCTITKSCPEKTLTTFYVCCGPAYPNTFLFSPLVESRMLPYLAAQGGYDGFLRWSYNDWTDDPFTHPEWGTWPTGDVFFIYPGEKGPISSLRWEQLREGIQDYELAVLAGWNIHTQEDMLDYDQAIRLACRNVDGRTKSLGDIEIARRLLMPIAERVKE